MFKLYQDTEKELFFDKDYKPVKLNGLNFTDLLSLLDNLCAAYDNACSYHANLLEYALFDDIVKTKRYYLSRFIQTMAAGTISIIISNTRYIEIDKAVNKTLEYIYHTNDINIFALDYSYKGICDLILLCYSNLLTIN